MKNHNLVVAICVMITLAIGAPQERATRLPMTFILNCTLGDCPLLKGVPQTRGMRGGSVKLNPGESVG